MSPLERRYRRLMWLLPAEHRAARGEELIGLLLDLDSDRTRPRPAEVLSLVVLAVRLHLRRLADLAGTPATVVLTSLLIAFGTMHAGDTLDAYTGAVLPTDLPALRARFWLDVIYGGIPLGAAIAWILGARRVALGLFGGLVAVATILELPFILDVRRFLVDPAGLVFLLSVPYLILAMLIVAAYHAWPAPRPRLAWLALVPLALLAWKGTGGWGRAGVTMIDYHVLAVPVAVSAAALAVFATNRRRWWVRVCAASAGLVVGWFLLAPVAYAVLWSHFNDGALPMAAMIAALPAAYGLRRLISRIRGRSASDPTAL